MSRLRPSTSVTTISAASRTPDAKKPFHRVAAHAGGVGEDEQDRSSVPLDESHDASLDDLTVPSILAAEARLRIVADP